MIKFESGIEIYHNTGDTLPTEGIPASSIALNMDDWTVSIYNGILWVPKGSKMVETELANGTYDFSYEDGLYTNWDIYVSLTEGRLYSVTFDGVKYETECKVNPRNGYLYVGAIEIIDGSGAEPSMPFLYTNSSPASVCATTTSGDHSIIIKTYEVQEV